MPYAIGNDTDDDRKEAGGTLGFVTPAQASNQNHYDEHEQVPSQDFRNGTRQATSCGDQIFLSVVNDQA